MTSDKDEAPDARFGGFESWSETEREYLIEEMIRGNLRYGERLPGCRYAATYLLRAVWALQRTPEDRLAYVDVLWEIRRMARDYLDVHGDDPSSPVKEAMRVLAAELAWTSEALFAESTSHREENHSSHLMATFY